ncbi:1-(5-phosphoribosyl)-5-[(5-phosphoribosylamino)methylideneamino]imidazole-4-carboxamide isomerase [Kiritimatiella glycovorans]|uniref:1-(5-phosphoribosyl)-5-[(5-phosphoribosylamino)methylideneamino] imidazole-4-carboxamide isomerase n=1 Tax=Kiritimatiella glycovorans TaxID=1307763 RepID=A0A0G3ELZ6_9BACT|nr:1-(5-phosphoribosyl)-5-[(5-phosphoribosylamino)methylideneamino]imidazole-4-carboxamide isomerase [Kiritimatiella glycovorans]AKJ65184.1 1-(5-phosphoribosyl)-5-[(5-phosphoribosylamino)methylideneamino] imidazole-4-carboxamide isomerase [Kiritimatiella glycovorans]
MVIYPAIDIRNGKCVRLLQGRAEDETVYADDPAEMARRWVGEGAQWLHVVDLDGAFEGAPRNTEALARICAASPVPVQTGGGLRTDTDLERVFAAGAARAVLGTRAAERPEDLAPLAARFGGDRLALGLDARDGKVRTRGWVGTCDADAPELARRAAEAGVGTLVYTDISRDGMMRGVNVDAMERMCRAVDCGVIASGGVSTADDVRALAALGCANLVGAIVGKALYEETVTLCGMRAAAGEP